MQPPYPPDQLPQSQPPLGPVSYPSPQRQSGPAQERPPLVGAPPPGASEAIKAATKAAEQSAQNLANVRGRYNNAAAQYDNHVNMTDTPDPLVSNAVAATFNEAQAALAKAEDDWATANRNLASAYAAEPGMQAQAKLYAAQSELASAEASVLRAKSTAETQKAWAEVSKARADAGRIASEISTLIPAQAASLNAQAEESNARVSSGIFRAQTERERAAADLTRAQAAGTRAETADLLPANVKNILAQAGYTEAQVRVLEQSLARPTQITQGLDRPNLAFQDPATGQVSGQRNPAYTNPNTQLLQNEYDTLSTIQGMMERNQISPQEGQSYMDSIRAQSQAALAGTTPFQQAQERNRYTEAAAGIGRDLLNNRVNNATSLANSLQQGLFGVAQTMTRPVDFSGIDPYMMSAFAAQEMGGGQQITDTAKQLVYGLSQKAPDGLPNWPPGTHVVSVPGPGGGQPQVTANTQGSLPRQMPVTIPDQRFQGRY